MRERVILLHGIWMRGLSLWPLAARLRDAGFEVEAFDYASVAGGPGRATRRLRARMGAGRGPVHLVGHSLGGLIALLAVAGANDLPPGRIVCLGSPLRGSGAARGLVRWPGGRWLLGRSGTILREGLPAWDGARAVGMIAGSRPLGLGHVVGTLPRPNDGTVAVEETRLPGLSDHCELPVTHTGLLFSAEAARRVVNFLREGRFGAC